MIMPAVMKKQDRTSTPIKDMPTGGHSRPVGAHTKPGMKGSRSDHTSLSSPSPRKPVSSPLSKTYLSKSHENLSSHQKKKLATFIEHRPKSSLGLPKGDPSKFSSSNKENLSLKEREKHGEFLKPRPVKQAGLTPIRKASSSQNIDKTGAKVTAYSNKLQPIKRAHSSHNVSKDKFSRKRTSAPADVMAYNAELLANFEKEKKLLESRISELIQITESRKAEIEKYKYENKRLKEQVPTHDIKDELEFLRKENSILREQLKELGYPIEQITDSEKLSFLEKTNKNAGSNDECSGDNGLKSNSCDSLSTDGARYILTPSGHKRNRRPVSVAMSDPGTCPQDLCGTPEHPSMFSMETGNWEKGSNKSSDALSEISVVCLTERILQMEETHYSTNEELQATLQELGDLQDSVNELTDENEKIINEKNVLLESLCTQTEKLEHCRMQISQLKHLFINGNFPAQTEREQQLLELLKGAEEEKDEYTHKYLELANALQSVENEHKDCAEIIETGKEKIQLLEDKISVAKSEKESVDKALFELKEISANDQIELTHYKTLLENEKSKVQELEQYCKAEGKSDLEELLHNTRQEKDKLEEKLACAQESLAHSQCEISRLKETLSFRDEELKVSRNNAKSQVDDLEFKIGNLESERSELKTELESLREHIDQLENDCDRYSEERKSSMSRSLELQKELSVLREEKETMEVELFELRSRHQSESEEWKQFQKDLQVAVLVANDFRAETQDDMEKITNENQSLKEKCTKLQSEIDRLNEEINALKTQKSNEDKSSGPKSIFTSAELKGKVLSTVDRGLTALREGKRLDSKNQTLSVKSLIRSIEEQVKSGCSSIHSSSCNSRRNSDSNDICSYGDIHDMVKSSSSSDLQQSDLNASSPDAPLRSVLKKPAERPSPLRHSVAGLNFHDGPKSPGIEPPKSAPPVTRNDTSPTITSILTHRGPNRRSSGGISVETPDRKEGGAKDPLLGLAKLIGGSKRNALLKWCQQKTVAYSGVDITNFSSSWNDGLAFCALLHNYIPDKIPITDLNSDDKRRNFTLAFSAAESSGVPTTLNINDMVAMERPDWQAVMSYVTSIYKHFEVDRHSST
ncbi:hypothetical protein KUTeg_009335 [Tegillarca granosa]|uniref:Calponin-homology (CH) domain-containing protein n=1 Tax=Tegillarca granosa TaxID=220873 RepID=A0ABQ9F3J0_TEGGR|nr:hypothetical protein KUTeg_009335 [Tegillarca granosa]